MRISRPLQFDLTKPSSKVLAVPNNRRHKARTKPTLTLSICFDREDDWLDVQEDSSSIEVSFSSAKISEFVEGVEDIKRGEGDYSMGGLGRNGQKNDIWFWWFISS
jgi:hypothetical protein